MIRINASLFCSQETRRAGEEKLLSLDGPFVSWAMQCP